METLVQILDIIKDLIDISIGTVALAKLLNRIKESKKS